MTTTTTKPKAQPRSIAVIAREINHTWQKVNYAARPYLDAMAHLVLITDKFYLDDAKEIVIYFLANATAWRGDDARRIKAELKSLYA